MNMADKLPGIPLNEEEMKLIVAGYKTVYSCKCYLKRSSGQITEISVADVKNDKACRSQCKERCKSSNDCKGYRIAFSAVDE